VQGSIAEDTRGIKGQEPKPRRGNIAFTVKGEEVNVKEKRIKERASWLIGVRQ
jgi:hypothetical protein